jgi:hypothetical protein
MSKSGLHNKPAGCGAVEAYVSGPGSEEEEEEEEEEAISRPLPFTSLSIHYSVSSHHSVLNSLGC